jgi:hypothetical protein
MAHGIDHSAELDNCSIAGALYDPAMRRGDSGINQIAPAVRAAAPE